jgi:outer membrane protein assembly factor BamB
VAGRYRWPAYRWALGGAIAAIVLAVATARALSHDADDGSAGGVGSPSGLVVSLLWRMPTGQPTTAPPAITADGVFLGGTDGKVRAFGRGGRLLWTSTATAGEAAYARADRGVVYAATAGGDIVAFGVGTGETLWRQTTTTTFSGPPAIGKSRLYTGGRDSRLYGFQRGGSHRYTRIKTGGQLRPTPTLINDAPIVASDDGKLYVTAEGRVRWTPRIGEPADGPIAADKAACTPLTDGSVRCVRAADGKVLPRISLPGTKLSALTSNGVLVFAAGADGAVGAWVTHTGVRQWLFRPRTPPAAAAHLVRRQDQIVAAYPDGRVIGLDVAAGNREWEVTLQDHFDTAPRTDDTAIYVVGRAGTLYALQAPGAAAATPNPAPTGTTASPPTRPRPQGGPRTPTTSGPSVTSPAPDGTTPTSKPTEQPPDVGGR